MGLKAPPSCSVFLFRQLCTRGKSPARRPRNAPLRGLNLSAQLSLVNLFLCEIFPKPFIPPLSSGIWNAGKKKIHFSFSFLFFFFFFFFKNVLFVCWRGWAEEKTKQTCAPRPTHPRVYVEAWGPLWVGGWHKALEASEETSATWASGPQPGPAGQRNTSLGVSMATSQFNWNGKPRALEPGAALQLHVYTRQVRGEEWGVGNFYFIFPRVIMVSEAGEGCGRAGGDICA